MKITTWNVNSITARQVHVVNFISRHQPDILLLQELKCVDEKFPHEVMEGAGYNIATHGQKTYNGVAILSKLPIEDVRRGIPGYEDDQARYIEATFSLEDGRAMSVASVYVPNGKEVGSASFSYKLKFLAALAAHARDVLAQEELFCIGGDYNVAPSVSDVYDDSLTGRLCVTPQEQAAFAEICNAGMYDMFRLLKPEAREFSWWDYRAGAWQHDKGYRIDHILASSGLADMSVNAEVNREERGRQKASDHAPVTLEVGM